jgi:ABC-2 type transport system ATP-binding protein
MIIVNELTKKYGSVTAVDRVSFGCEPGTITGFLGPNGAGKPDT